MAAGAQHRTEALVLRRVDYGDADLILTLYTPDLGKVAAIARSARRSQKRFGGAISLLTLSRVELSRAPERELFTMSSASLVRSYRDLALDVARFAHASYGTELVRELTPEEQPDRAIYALLVELHECLLAHGAEPLVLRAFELALLGAIGLAPVLERCVACGADSEEAFEGAVVLDLERGGVVCTRCATESRGRGVRPLSGAARALLRTLQTAPSLEAALGARQGAEDADLARDALVATVLHHVGKPLKSLEFVAKMSASVVHSR